jgi:hypothetical protein
MNNWCIRWFFTHIFTFLKGSLRDAFGVKGLTSNKARTYSIIAETIAPSLFLPNKRSCDAMFKLVLWPTRHPSQPVCARGIYPGLKGMGIDTGNS